MTPDWSNCTAWMASVEQGFANRCWVGKTVTMTIMTESKVHAEDEILMTIPDGWTPIIQLDIPAYYRNGCCVLRLKTDGTLRIWILNDTTNTSRVYASFTYIMQ